MYTGDRYLITQSTKCWENMSACDCTHCGILMLLCQSVSQSAEFLALKHKSRILRQDECPRILLSCYRARNSGPDITSPKVALLLHFSLTLSKIRIGIENSSHSHAPKFSDSECPRILRWTSPRRGRAWPPPSTRPSSSQGRCRASWRSISYILV